jgi:hypothetical protein
MTPEYPENMAGFKVPLYALFHIRNLDSRPPFDSKQAAKARKDYGEEKLKIIKSGLNWAIHNRDVDYKNIFPGMKYSNKEILTYFEDLLREMNSTGI